MPISLTALPAYLTYSSALATHVFRLVFFLFRALRNSSHQITFHYQAFRHAKIVAETRGFLYVLLRSMMRFALSEEASLIHALSISF